MIRQFTGVMCMVLAAGQALSIEAAPPESAPRAPSAQILPPPLPVPEDAAAPALQLGETNGGPSERVWADAEYLLWWMKGASLPPLITTSPAGTPPNQAGVLGTPGATVLFGGSRVNDDGRSGGRFAIGLWCDCERTLGIEANFLILESRSAGFGASSTGSPILARPFIDATTGQPAAELIAFPGNLAGSVAATAESDGLIGAGILARKRLCCGCNYRLDALAGYRFLHLSDNLNIAEELVNTNPENPNFIPLGTQVDVTDRFKTQNDFHGFDLGLAADFSRGPVLLRVLGKVALGGTHQTVDIAGATTVTVPGLPPASNVGGLLALPSNSGGHNRDVFSVVPEVGVQLGYQVTPRLSAWVGYSFLYWSNVVRAGDQVNLAINPGLLPPPVSPLTGPLEPAFHFQRSDLWAQGIDLGFEFRF